MCGEWVPKVCSGRVGTSEKLKVIKRLVLWSSVVVVEMQRLNVSLGSRPCDCFCFVLFPLVHLCDLQEQRQRLQGQAFHKPYWLMKN